MPGRILLAAALTLASAYGLSAQEVTPQSTPPAQTAPQIQSAPVESAPTAPLAGQAAPDPAVAAPQAPSLPATPTQPSTQVDGAVTPTPESATVPHDLTPWGMFMAADIVVKAVMIGLALASVLTWAILVFKAGELGTGGKRVRRAVRIASDATSLQDAVQAFGSVRGPVRKMLQAAMNELEKSEAIIDHTDGSGVKERVESHLSRIEIAAGKSMAKGTGILATIGSISPFVGLFGTVWGIMNSFIGISESQTTNLAVVAPGIAEALLATAIGLVAAIPAVVIYNIFARAIGTYRQYLADASAAVERLVSRDLDFRAARHRPGTSAAILSAEAAKRRG